MGITFSIEAAKGIVYTTVTGPLLDADPVQYMRDVLDHPAYRQNLSALVFCTKVELGTFSTAAIHRLAEFSRSAEHQLRGTRVAIAAEQPAVYGIARMYQMLRDPPYEVRVFRSVAQAEAWLAEDVTSMSAH